MKDFIEKGLVATVITAIIAVAGLIFATAVLIMIGTLLGNLAFWPILGAALLGYKISLEMTIAIAVLMAIVIFAGVMFYPDGTGRFLDRFASVFVGGSMLCVAAFFLSIPGSLLFHYLTGQKPGWWTLPIGFLTALLIFGFLSVRNRAKLRD